MDLTARVAVVGGVTGAAILAGHRLRRVLPAVGAVVFHLGALLLPVDALGLAIQIDATTAARWGAVGLTAVLALPLLAVVGRSRVLGVAGLAGVPVVANAVGIAGLAAPEIVLAAGAAVACLIGDGRSGTGADDNPLASVRRLSAPVLAFSAVAGPLAVALFARLSGPGTMLGSASSGWVAGSWEVPAAVGTVAVAVLAVTATRRRDLGVAGLTVATAVLAVVVTLLPPGTPRTVVVLAPALVWLVAELAALAGRDHTLWAAPTRQVLAAVELVAVVAALRTIGVVVLPAEWSGVTIDHALAAQALVLAAAWAVAALRHAWVATHGAAVAMMVGSVVVHVAAATRLFGADATVTTVVLLLGALVTLVTLADRFPGGADDRSGLLRSAGDTAPFVALTLIVLATVVAVDRAVLVAVVVVLPLVTGAHLRGRLRRTGHLHDVAALLVLAVPVLGWASALLDEADALPSGLALVLGTLGVLWLAAACDRLEPAADTLRALALVAGLTVLVPDVGTRTLELAGTGGAWWAVGLRLVPGAVLPALVVGGWLVVDAVRGRRMTPAVLAVPLLIRGLAGILFEVGTSVGGVGAVLLAVAIVAGVVSVVGPPAAFAPAVTVVGVAGPFGWLLIGPTPWLRAGAITVAGLAIAGIGLVRGRPLVANLGGVVAIIGTWQLSELAGLDTSDVRLLPVAAHLAVAGELARRKGTSSWIAFVPPLLLVTIPALVERIGGGEGWHAVLAGVLAVAAVVVGGMRRLGGPLVVGTVMAVAVVLVETFAVVAAVPTWVWLAIGGLVLIGAAALIERTGGSPVRAVRRAVDVVGERFA